jgi:hypothetical protein
MLSLPVEQNWSSAPERLHTLRCVSTRRLQESAFDEELDGLARLDLPLSPKPRQRRSDGRRLLERRELRKITQ